MSTKVLITILAICGVLIGGLVYLHMPRSSGIHAGGSAIHLR
jgi:hypothetical protein